MISKEIWKPVQGFEDNYEVSNLGTVRAKDRIIQTTTGFRHYKARELKPEITQDGHYRVVLSNAGHKKRVFVHRLVALAFIPNPQNYPVINHKDGNPANNTVDNLEWTTVQENVLHAYKLGLSNIEKTKEANSKPIIMYDIITHQPLQEFPSMIECERQTQYSKSTISYHCNNLAIPKKLSVYFRYKNKE